MFETRTGSTSPKQRAKKQAPAPPAVTKTNTDTQTGNKTKFITSKNTPVPSKPPSIPLNLPIVTQKLLEPPDTGALYKKFSTSNKGLLYFVLLLYRNAFVSQCVAILF